MMICGKEEKVLPSISNQNYKGDLALSCTVVGRGALCIVLCFTRTFVKKSKSGMKIAFMAWLYNGSSPVGGNFGNGYIGKCLTGQGRAGQVCNFVMT